MATTGGFCADCFKGTLRGDVEPAGTVETIHGLPTYVARPENGQQPVGLVVIISDALGWELRNSRALADAYARRGPFLVYLPDFENGHAPDPSLLSLVDNLHAPNKSWATCLFKVPFWWLRWAFNAGLLFWHIQPSVSKPLIWRYFQAIRDSPPPESFTNRPRIGVAGFCWGGLFCVQLCGEPDLVDCGFTAHPSLLTIPGDIEGVQKPLSVANGEDDEWMGRERMAQLKEILESKEGMEVVIYEGAQHGFAVRGDPHDPRQAEMGMRAEDQAVAWFKMQFG